MNLPKARNGAGRTRRLAVRFGFLMLFGAIVATAVWYATRPKPITVVVAEVDRGRVEKTVANTRAGSVMVCRRAKLAPPTGRRIEKLNVHKGDRVRPGEVLLTLWNDDLAARERVAREQVQTAKAHVREICELAKASARGGRTLSRH